VLSNRTALAIEEPENFLHPYMQAEIIDMIRRRTKRQRMFALVTTHSETLLNAVEPAEVIVISRHDGVTLAARPSNTSDLAGEIRETGFGLGYFYVAGALD
jgi:predicted ATPase